MKKAVITFALIFLMIAGVGFKTLAQAQEVLAGKIWNSQQARFVSFPEMLTTVINSKYILIGERHGRTAHQNREAFLLAALAEQGRFPDLYLEMLTQDQNETIEAYRKHSPEYTLGLAIKLKWHETNWPAWSFYQPIFDIAFAAKLRIEGADIAQTSQASDLVEIRVNSASLAYYVAGMKKAHCGLISEDRALELAHRQLKRDQAMAGALLKSASHNDGAVLIAGSAHTRNSVAIPTRLPKGSFSTIALRETSLSLPQFYEQQAEETSAHKADYNFIWFTPKTNETSFCDRLK